jgi:hypothetical protein
MEEQIYDVTPGYSYKSGSQAAMWPVQQTLLPEQRLRRSEQMSESEINNMGVAGLIGLGATLGVVHVLTGADHMSALAQLSCGARLKGFWLGVRWGIGHSSGLLLMCVVQPLVHPRYTAEKRVHLHLALFALRRLCACCGIPRPLDAVFSPGMPSSLLPEKPSTLMKSASMWTPLWVLCLLPWGCTGWHRLHLLFL